MRDPCLLKVFCLIEVSSNFMQEKITATYLYLFMCIYMYIIVTCAQTEFKYRNK